MRLFLVWSISIILEKVLLFCCCSSLFAANGELKFRNKTKEAGGGVLTTFVILVEL